MNSAQFRGGNENLPSSVDVLHKTSTLVISRCCFANDGKEMDKSEKMHEQSVQSYWFCSLNMQICDVLVVLTVVVRDLNRDLKIYDGDVDDNATKQ